MHGENLKMYNSDCLQLASCFGSQGTSPGFIRRHKQKVSTGRY